MQNKERENNTTIQFLLIYFMKTDLSEFTTMSKITLIFPTSLELPACLHSNSTVTWCLQELHRAGHAI